MAAPNIPRVTSTRPLVNAYTPPIPQPAQNGENLLACVVALKAGVESLIGQRGDAANRAVTFHDLVSFGVLKPQAVTSPRGSVDFGEGGGISEAPIDGFAYGRLDENWARVLLLTGGSINGNLAVTGTTTLGATTVATPAAADNSTNAATTAWVTSKGYLTSVGAGTIYAPINSPVFTGDPRAPTPSLGDNDTSIVTSAWVNGQGYLTSAGAASVYAPINSPVFTGDPRAPTPAVGDNDTSVATTAFVKSQGYLTGNQSISLTTDVTGSGTTSIASTVVGLRGRPVANIAPTTNQVLSWDGAQWLPVTVSGGSGNYVLKTGDTMSGQLTTAWSAPNAAVDLRVQNTAPDGHCGLQLQSNGKHFLLSKRIAATDGNSFQIWYNDGTTYSGPLFRIDPGGATTIKSPAGYTSLYLDTPTPGMGMQIVGQRNGSTRWLLRVGSDDAEGGSNTGTDFTIHRYNDSGGLLAEAMRIKRDSGNVFFGNSLTLAGNYLTFVNSGFAVNITGGPLIYADTNTMVFKQGSNTNGFWWQNYTGYVVAKITGDTAHLQIFQPTSTTNYIEIYNDGNSHINTPNELYVNWWSQQNTSFGGAVHVYNSKYSWVHGGRFRAAQSGNDGNYLEHFDDGNGHINSNTRIWINYYSANETAIGGNLIIARNNYGISGTDTGGSTYFMMGLLNDNRLWIGDGTHAINFQSSGTIPSLTINGTLTQNGQIWCSSDILCGNDRWYYGRTNGNNYYDILGCIGNLTYVGNATWDTRMRAASSVWTQCHIAPLSNNTYYCGHSGSLWYQVQSYSFYNPSDISLKHDIAEAPSCLDVVRAIKPKTFKYNDSPDTRTHWGFVAQDVAHEMREAGLDFGGHIPVDELTPHEGLAYHELTAVLWRAVQELAAKLEARDG